MINEHGIRLQNRLIRRTIIKGEEEGWTNKESYLAAYLIANINMVVRTCLIWIYLAKLTWMNEEWRWNKSSITISLLLPSLCKKYLIVLASIRQWIDRSSPITIEYIGYCIDWAKQIMDIAWWLPAFFCPPAAPCLPRSRTMFDIIYEHKSRSSSNNRQVVVPIKANNHT